MKSKNLQIKNSNDAQMESTDLQILNSNKVEADPISLNSDVIGDIKNGNDHESEDDDIELQQILFYSAQFHSGKNSEPNFYHDVEMEYSVIYGSLNLKNSTREIGESSCTFCEICKNAFPLPNTLMRGTNCNHRYCEECIQNCISKRINNDILEVIMRCPISGCKGILDLKSVMPIDFLMRLEDANRLAKVLASPLVINCPSMDCMGTLVDDLRGYPIRACPKCWRIFCVKCRDLHLGMTCDDYQYNRQLDLLHWKQYGGCHDYDDYDDEEEVVDDDDEEKKEEEREETP